MADASADPRVGEVLEGRYRILERLASGGMGVVYRGERVHLGRAVAVKFLDGAGATDDNSRARFEREAKAMSRLSHPHCVSVIDFGMAPNPSGVDTPYIVMDYVTGQPLINVAARTRLKAHRVVHIMKQVMAGLAHAHNQEVIHRDIKPANIMLTEATGTGDFVRILDFGLAKLRGASSLSSANVVIGTPSYMSPEQGSGKPIDGRTDIYSSGVILYELLVGVKPFVGEDAFATLRMHQSEKVPHLGEIRGSSELRDVLDPVVQKAMAKKPSARFQTALEMGKALARIEEAHRPPLPPAGGKSRTRKDPARATTQLAAEPAPADTGSSLKDEQTSILPSGSEIPSEPSGSFLGGLARGVFALIAVGAIGAAGWYAWQARSAGDEGGGPTSAKSGQTPDPAPPVAQPPIVDAAPPPSIDATALALVADAGADAIDPLAMAAPDASALVIHTDAGASDGGAPIDPDEEDDEDAGPTVAPVAPVVPGALPKVVNSYADVKLLLAAGKRAAAIAGLRKLLRRDPKNGFYHLKIGHLYFEQTGWTAGLGHYRRAVTLRRKYRSYATVNRNAIRALGSNKTRGTAHSFIVRSLGRAALPYLARAARSDRSAVVRKRASYAIKKIR